MVCLVRGILGSDLLLEPYHHHDHRATTNLNGSLILRAIDTPFISIFSKTSTHEYEDHNEIQVQEGKVGSIASGQWVANVVYIDYVLSASLTAQPAQIC